MIFEIRGGWYDSDQTPFVDVVSAVGSLKVGDILRTSNDGETWENREVIGHSRYVDGFSGLGIGAKTDECRRYLMLCAYNQILDRTGERLVDRRVVVSCVGLVQSRIFPDEDRALDGFRRALKKISGAEVVERLYVKTGEGKAESHTWHTNIFGSANKTETGVKVVGFADYYSDRAVVYFGEDFIRLYPEEALRLIRGAFR